MNELTVLVVDDEADIRELIAIALQSMNLKCILACDITQAKKLLATEKVDVCLTDMRLPDGDGLDLTVFIQQNYPSIPVAVITAYASVDLAVKALKLGAFDFVCKPVNISVLKRLIQAAIKQKKIGVDENVEINLIGGSNALQEIKALINKVAKSQAPILITGESGTGKELIARLIHQKSARREKDFVAINCGAIPSELMESEFFGYVKGSFTGAQADKKGLFQAADESTLFLDEIADLPLHMQVKLLRAIQEKAIRPVGSNQEISIDCRIISATNKDLMEFMQSNKFRQDLFYRINVIEIHLPPLRERKEDLKTLIDYFLLRLSQESGHELCQLSEDAYQKLLGYSFPGNIRELENILSRAVALADDKYITPKNISLPDMKQGMEGNLVNNLDYAEKNTIIQALKAQGWDKTRTANSLNISVRSLRYRMKKLNIPDRE